LDIPSLEELEIFNLTIRHVARGRLSGRRRTVFASRRICRGTDVPSMSVRVDVVATVRRWSPDRQDKVGAALKQWAQDERFADNEIIVEIFRGTRKKPGVYMEAYTPSPVLISHAYTWQKTSLQRLRKRIKLAGGDGVSLEYTYPDDEEPKAGRFAATATGARKTSRTGLETAPGNIDIYCLRAAQGDRYLVAGGGKKKKTFVIDVSVFPPSVHTLDGYSTDCAAFSPDGRLWIWGTYDPMGFKNSLFEADHGILRPSSVKLPWSPGCLRSTPAGVVVFPSAGDARTVSRLRERRPCLLAGRELIPLEQVGPAETLKEVKYYSSVECDAVPFGDDSVLVVWDRRPYRLTGCEVAPLSGGGLEVEGMRELSSGITLADGAVAACYSHKLRIFSPSGARKTALPLDNVMKLIRGPGGELVIREGENPENDFLKVWWPATRELTRIGLDVFGLKDSADAYWVVCSHATARLVVYRGGDERWLALPWSTVVKLPRVTEAQFAATRGKRPARKARTP
jgi:hypothetical protein